MLLNTDDLKKWLGYKRKADVINWLDKRGIGWQFGHNKEICTTLDAVTHGIEATEKRTPARFG